MHEPCTVARSDMAVASYQQVRIKEGRSALLPLLACAKGHCACCSGSRRMSSGSGMHLLVDMCMRIAIRCLHLHDVAAAMLVQLCMARGLGERWHVEHMLLMCTCQQKDSCACFLQGAAVYGCSSAEGLS